MSGPVKKNRFENEPIAGRIDVLCYRVSEAAVKQVEANMGIGGLWDQVKWPIEEMVHENITKYAIYSPKEVLNSPWWKYAVTFLQASRKKGNM